ncbi:carbohydrate ABC transporter permease [Undibacterium pigrum]|uniref:Maltose/maltodextrin transport system permease protein MalG n=1 Tax=Undibacterium pigrum TaxID=401470 RepID=A0A318JBG8_9BURK|nr:carbohydrate ABC transporter permease [Undibacterium pigrum]PXX44197.1 carbohydrate ABC transporter membrane protein 2 (CUT1 family) [Undibacterium pigrum]
MPSNKNKLKRSLLCWLALSPLVTVILLPFAVMLLTAIKPADEVLSYPPRWLPTRIAWENFVLMWEETQFGTALKNSIIISTLSTLLAVGISIPAAYAMARFRFDGQAGYRRFLLVTQMLSPILLVLGLFRLAAAIPYGDGNLVDTHIGVIATYTALNTAFAVWMLQSYFATIPRDMEEAAWLEGCSKPRAVLKVFLPLAMPALVVTGIFTFINAWNEFAVIYTLIRSAENKTVTVQIVDLVAGRYTVNWHHVMAAALLATLPVAVLFSWLQKYLVKGLSLGAVK